MQSNNIRIAIDTDEWLMIFHSFLIESKSQTLPFGHTEYSSNPIAKSMMNITTANILAWDIAFDI